MDTFFARLFADGRAAELVVALMCIEAIAIAWLARRSGRRFVATFAATLAAGACLVLALRAALNAAAWTDICAWLLAAGVAHACDLAMRWRDSAAVRTHSKPLVGRVGIEPTTKGL